MTGATARRLVAIALIAGTALGCASGAVTGRVAVPGQPVAPLDMMWSSGLFGESGKMSAVMPDGEQFSGTYRVVRPGISRTSLDPAWTGDVGGDAQGQITDDFWGAGRDQQTFVRGYLNKAIATLRSGRGTTMLCRFDLLDGSGGMGGGGSGECQTSTGAKITAQF
jgi:hypothetical protein